MNLRSCCVGLLAAALAAGCVTTERSVPGREPDNREAARVNTDLGINYLRKGLLDFAREKLEKAVEQDPDYAAAHSAIALLYHRLGEHRKAKYHYKEALDLSSDDPDTQNSFGVFLCSQGDIDDAEEQFLEAARNPRNLNAADSWANAGVCVRREDLGRAEEYFREALRLNPRHPNALAQMAQLAFDRKEYLRARAFMQRYESVSPATPATLWIAAQTERQLGDLMTARQYERRLRKEFPDSAETYELIKRSSSTP